ncbi:hypothetical protein CONCODRAFT_7977 [Conidiobolus coronatus NRRL 28638]|uniref:ATP-dependent RNA helicase Ski2/MTR4 C-terminal domain-containing protein n=1 Tax=Conidiobolus coronatus (strain ATCC 28846 / CBS 209.66 / NRRL 28638) TaxID=796925 RepID=A0A137P3H0_CONC2|nr:hypothetical protein CONCODRAFT_7977 [Conidiobolus coronatus NRRL 28638]|eukprot:KXN69565.1 hypothetical protein CONCODRAFT_7977 [Conidiobolus coronatus NRRL 28638]
MNLGPLQQNKTRNVGKSKTRKKIKEPTTFWIAYYITPANNWVKMSPIGSSNQVPFLPGGIDNLLPNNPELFSLPSAPTPKTRTGLKEHISKASNLPPHITIILLSATVPNTKEFADQLPNSDLTTSTEKSEFPLFLRKTLIRLKGEDRLCLGYTPNPKTEHHGGLLPIVKEIVEILFSRGLDATGMKACNNYRTSSTYLFNCIKCPDHLPHFRLISEEETLRDQLNHLYHVLTDQNLDEFLTVLLKGRVACEIKTADELLLTELILKRLASEPNLTENLLQGQNDILALAQTVGNIQVSKLFGKLTALSFVSRIFLNVQKPGDGECHDSCDGIVSACRCGGESKYLHCTLGEGYRIWFSTSQQNPNGRSIICK